MNSDEQPQDAEPEEPLDSAGEPEVPTDAPGADMTEDNADQASADAPVEEPVNLETQQVHIYEYGKYKRTIDRPLTEEQAKSFVEVYGAASPYCGRTAVATVIGETPPDELPPE